MHNRAGRRALHRDPREMQRAPSRCAECAEPWKYEIGSVRLCASCAVPVLLGGIGKLADAVNQLALSLEPVYRDRFFPVKPLRKIREDIAELIPE